MEDCVFCKIVRGEIPSEKVFESDNFVVIKDVNPKVNGHSLVISKKHYSQFLDVPDSSLGEFFEVAKEAGFKLLGEVGARGFNLVLNNGKVAGQVVEHVHLHILPRKEGDGFELNL